MTLPIHSAVHVCFDRDIECGDFERNWCATCPKRKPIHSADAELEAMRTAFENSRQYRSKLQFKRGGSVFAEGIPEDKYVDNGVQAAWEFWQEAYAAARAAAKVGANGAADIPTWADAMDSFYALHPGTNRLAEWFMVEEIKSLRYRLTAGATASTAPDQQTYCTMNCSRKEACADCAPPAKDQK